MKIQDIISHLESIAPASYQENYDNTGLLTGSPDWNCDGAMLSLDCTEEVIQEAIKNNVNLVIAHHPIIFTGLKKLNGKNYVERAIITAIKNDIAIFAIHTNLDNIHEGVNGAIADRLGLLNRYVLLPKKNTLRKLYTFVPAEKAEDLRQAMFDAGGGVIGKYDHCSFNTEGSGTFRAGEGTNPYVGEKGKQHVEKEVKVELVFPAYLEAKIIDAMKRAHPYQEVAFDIIELSNPHPAVGSGLVGHLQEAMNEEAFLSFVKKQFGLRVIRHSPLLEKQVKKVAICGGAGSFLIPFALREKADVFITADMKYHEFFDADGRMVIADIGHYESERFTVDLVSEVLQQKFPTFALLKSKVTTNPVNYFLS